MAVKGRWNPLTERRIHSRAILGHARTFGFGPLPERLSGEAFCSHSSGVVIVP